MKKGEKPKRKMRAKKALQNSKKQKIIQEALLTLKKQSKNKQKNKQKQPKHNKNAIDANHPITEDFVRRITQIQRVNHSVAGCVARRIISSD